ncbi:MAG TPA: hypothetical protein PKJ85_10520 [Nitrosomonas nitrosa]|nr:hypothetical protein [Nitrosomonas nitrosa]
MAFFQPYYQSRHYFSAIQQLRDCGIFCTGNVSERMVLPIDANCAISKIHVVT